MSYKPLIIDLTAPVDEIQLKLDNHNYESEMEFINCKDETVNKLDQLKFPDYINERETDESTYTKCAVTFKGDLKTFILPDIADVSCWSMGIEKLVVPDTVLYLHCSRNELTELDLPSTLKALCCEDNKVERITFRGGDPLDMFSLNIRNNRIKTFDYRLSGTKLTSLYIGDNPGIKMKYTDCVFTCPETYQFILDTTDIDETLFGYTITRELYMRARLHDLNQRGHTYITYDDLLMYPHEYLENTKEYGWKDVGCQTEM